MGLESPLVAFSHASIAVSQQTRKPTARGLAHRVKSGYKIARAEYAYLFLYGVECDDGGDPFPLSTPFIS